MCVSPVELVTFRPSNNQAGKTLKIFSFPAKQARKVVCSSKFVKEKVKTRRKDQSQAVPNQARCGSFGNSHHFCMTLAKPRSWLERIGKYKDEMIGLVLWSGTAPGVALLRMDKIGESHNTTLQGSHYMPDSKSGGNQIPDAMTTSLGPLLRGKRGLFPHLDESRLRRALNVHRYLLQSWGRSVEKKRGLCDMNAS